VSGCGKLPLAVLPLTADSGRAAQALASELRLPLLSPGIRPGNCDGVRALLLVDGEQLALQLAGKSAAGPVAVDFGASAMRHRRRAGHNELLGRAVGVGKKPGLVVLDATAGLGRDSFVLADLGCQVQLFERNPVICKLLQQGIRRARGSGDDWLAAAAQRMQLRPGDARSAPVEDMDVIYLDPMFPAGDKRAAVKKDMAMFQFLLQGESGDESLLMSWALDQAVARVVVKRSLRAGALSGIAPSHSIRGKAVRYDVYVKRGLV